MTTINDSDQRWAEAVPRYGEAVPDEGFDTFGYPELPEEPEVAGDGGDTGDVVDGVGQFGGTPAPDITGAAESDADTADTAGDAGEPVDLDTPVDLDALAAAAAEPDEEPAPTSPAVKDGGAGGPARFDPKVARLFGAGVVVAVVVALVGAFMFYSSPSDPAGKRPLSVADPVTTVAVAPAAEASAAASNDRPLLYSADAAGSCPAGSTSAQTMSGADPHNAFVCVRGGADGQVIDIELSQTYTVTAISLTPGWVGKDASGVSQWSQHRVVTTVQYMFNDNERTVLTQETKNVHGESVLPVKRVVASKLRMLIRQTSRPPADTAAPSENGDGGLFPAGQLPSAPLPFPGAPLGGQPNTDPVDATFAISSLKIIGHEPL